MIQPGYSGSRNLRFVWLAFALLIARPVAADVPDTERLLRPPAVPLVTHDPYFSVWSMSDRLTDDWSRHWTGRIQALCGMVRIDGKAFRFAGPQPATVPPLPQKHLSLTPTRTTYS